IGAGSHGAFGRDHSDPLVLRACCGCFSEWNKNSENFFIGIRLYFPQRLARSGVAGQDHQGNTLSKEKVDALLSEPVDVFRRTRTVWRTSTIAKINIRILWQCAYNAAQYTKSTESRVEKTDHQPRIHHLTLSLKIPQYVIPIACEPMKNTMCVHG